MKQQPYVFVSDALGKPFRVRISKSSSNSTAQRQREFRQRQKFNFLDRHGQEGNSIDFLSLSIFGGLL